MLNDNRKNSWHISRRVDIKKDKKKKQQNKTKPNQNTHKLRFQQFGAGFLRVILFCGLIGC